MYYYLSTIADVSANPKVTRNTVEYLFIYLSDSGRNVIRYAVWQYFIQVNASAVYFSPHMAYTPSYRHMSSTSLHIVCRTIVKLFRISVEPPKARVALLDI
jgi:hypothetical protein